MIFDANYTSTSGLSAIKESPYELGLAGAMMHVYENECNYNAIMKAVGLSELKYYQETGKDLFVHEAGAFDGFIAKMKAFFKAVIEKIKSIFKKFVAMFDQYTISDKQFVKKYGDQLIRKDLKDFEFTGYKFGDFAKVQRSVEVAGGALQKVLDTYTSSHKKDSNYDTDEYDNRYYKDSDVVNEKKEKHRANVIGQSGKMDETEFKDKLKELLYGDDNKETLDNISIRDQLSIIENTKDDIKKVEKTQKEIEKGINDLLKTLDKLPSEIRKQYSYSSDNKLTDQQDKRINNAIRNINDVYDVSKSMSNDITIAFGMIVQAYKDRNRQAKAICVKALSYKHEAAMVSESSYSDDIFAGVVIR